MNTDTESLESPKRSVCGKRTEALLRQHKYKFNIFQLAKRVRRAKRAEKSFEAVLAYKDLRPAHPIPFIQEHREKRRELRRSLANTGLRHCRSLLGLALYYFDDLNILDTPVAL